jgi:SARP family transcriptional regulator, regulator of embCAB operon
LGSPMVTRVFVLGRVEIESEGGLITEPRFPGRQGRKLFAYLACNRQQPVTPEELAEALWRDALPPAWGSALHALISKLRKLLDQVGGGGALSLTAEHGNYLLRIGGDVWIDREAAAEAIDEAEALLRAGDVKQAWGPCNIAAISARRPFLPGEEGDWIERERGRLHAILVRALDCLADIWLANDEPALAIEAARGSIELEPFRETGYQRLIRLHTALGNRAEALRVYEDCRQLLVSELGVDPSPDTEALFLELLAQS